MCIAKGILRHVNVCGFWQLVFFLHIMFKKFIYVVGDAAGPLYTLLQYSSVCEYTLLSPLPGLWGEGSKTRSSIVDLLTLRWLLEFSWRCWLDGWILKPVIQERGLR